MAVFAYEDPEAPPWSKLWPIGFAQLDMRSDLCLKRFLLRKHSIAAARGRPGQISSPYIVRPPYTWRFASNRDLSLSFIDNWSAALLSA